MKNIIILAILSIFFTQKLKGSEVLKDVDDELMVLIRKDMPLYGTDTGLRKKMVEWCDNIAEKARCSPTYTARTFEIFDRHIRNELIPYNDFTVYICAAFVLTLKLFEGADVGPIIVKLTDNWGLYELRQAEACILRSLKWELCYPIPADYIYLFFKGLPAIEQQYFTNCMREYCERKTKLRVKNSRGCQTSLQIAKQIIEKSIKKNIKNSEIKKEMLLYTSIFFAL